MTCSGTILVLLQLLCVCMCVGVGFVFVIYVCEQGHGRELKPSSFCFHFEHEHFLKWVIYLEVVTCCSVLSLVLLPVVRALLLHRVSWKIPH